MAHVLLTRVSVWIVCKVSTKPHPPLLKPAITKRFDNAMVVLLILQLRLFRKPDHGWERENSMPHDDTRMSKFLPEVILWSVLIVHRSEYRVFLWPYRCLYTGM